MKKHLQFIFLLSCGCMTLEDKPVKLSGETSYVKDKTESLNTKLRTEYRYKVYEPKDKTWETHVTGTIITDYDHLRGEMKNSAFTTFGVEF